MSKPKNPQELSVPTYWFGNSRLPAISCTAALAGKFLAGGPYSGHAFLTRSGRKDRSRNLILFRPDEDEVVILRKY